MSEDAAGPRGYLREVWVGATGALARTGRSRSAVITQQWILRIPSPVSSASEVVSEPAGVWHHVCCC